MNSNNPTSLGRWLAVLDQVLPEPTRLALSNVHVMGPFENAGYQGLLTAYPPEQKTDLTGVYRGKTGEVKWQPAPGLEGVSLEQPIDLGAWIPSEPWSVLYVYAEIEAITSQIAGLSISPQGWFGPGRMDN